MKQRVLWVALAGAVAVPVAAQEPIYRCGNEYTNTKPAPGNKDCKLLEGGNVTVVEGMRATQAAQPKAAQGGASPAGSAPRVDAEQQKARDTDARRILQDELKKALARHEALLAEYKDGQPDKQGNEVRNHQKYLDRVADLKASLARNESDIAGIRRELERLAPAKP